MDILKLITEQINNPDTLKKLGTTAGVEPEKVQQLAKLGMPALLKAMERNAGTPEGAEALNKALEQHKDEDVDDIDGFLKNFNMDDGAKMLKHIFAGNDARVENNLAKQTGLQTGQVSGIMTQLAPLLMGALGKQKQQQNLDSSGLGGMLSGLLSQGGGSGIMGVVTNLLDSDKDGDIMDDIGNLLGGLFKK